jgi:hypothetical protein
MRTSMMVLAAGLWPAFAFAQYADGGYLTGNDLLTKCTEEHGRSFCMGYVAGVVDTLQTAANAKHWQTDVCLPETGFHVGQSADVVTKYLRAYPEYRHRVAANIAWRALLVAFPCKEQAR